MTGILSYSRCFGLCALLQASEKLFMVLKIVGAAYLIYLGIKTFRSPLPTLEVSGKKDITCRDLFLQGAISNLSNPKIAIFLFCVLITIYIC